MRTTGRMTYEQCQDSMRQCYDGKWPRAEEPPTTSTNNLFVTVGNAKGTCLDRDCRGASALSHAHSAQGAGPQRRAKTLTTSKNEFARRAIRGGLFHCDWPPMSLRPCRANSAPTMAIEKSPQRTPQRDSPKPPKNTPDPLGYTGVPTGYGFRGWKI